MASLQAMASLATPMALRVAVTLGLPERLAGEGASVLLLAEELEASIVGVERLLKHLITLVVVELCNDRYRTTELGAELRADAENQLHNTLHINSAIGRAELAFVEFGHAVTIGQAAYPRRYGRDFWADLAEFPHRQRPSTSR